MPCFCWQLLGNINVYIYLGHVENKQCLHCTQASFVSCLSCHRTCLYRLFLFFLTFFWNIMSQKKMDIHSDCNEHRKRSENVTAPPPTHRHHHFPPHTRQWWILRHYWASQNQWRGSPFSWWSQSLVPQIGDCIWSIGVIWLCDAACTFLHHRSIRRKTMWEAIWEALIYVAVDLELVSHVYWPFWRP